MRSLPSAAPVLVHAPLSPASRSPTYPLPTIEGGVSLVAASGVSVTVTGSDVAGTSSASARDAVTSKVTSCPTCSGPGTKEWPVSPATGVPSTSHCRLKLRSLPSAAPVLVQEPS